MATRSQLTILPKTSLSLCAIPLIALSLCAACGPSHIEAVEGLTMDPTSEIVDTQTHREVLEVLTNYHNALEARDPDALERLVSKDYYENAGTSESTSDDYGYRGLVDALKLLTKVEVVKCDILIKDLRVDGDRAQVFYEYSFNYLFKIGGVPRWEAGRDVNRMDLLQNQETKKWEIYRGL